ncbi:MAG: hypothetical protein KatS3mg032_0019 [Cyclobacteriaceae bacterium]|nr:MAG: hypothetical protein KatS3mg032_0019 [Cyclobacteriaceae bacterium]
MKTERLQTVVLITASIGGLLMVYLLQRVNIGAFFNVEGTYYQFVINRSIRFVLNDFFVILLIYALFRQKKFVLFALLVQAAGLLFILLPYFLIKYYHPQYNGPLISFLHRLVINPLLMLLLIPAFYLQQSGRATR